MIKKVDYNKLLGRFALHRDSLIKDVVDFCRENKGCDIKSHPTLIGCAAEDFQVLYNSEATLKYVPPTDSCRESVNVVYTGEDGELLDQDINDFSVDEIFSIIDTLEYDE